jgi:hypothetical protein
MRQQDGPANRRSYNKTFPKNLKEAVRRINRGTASFNAQLPQQRIT